MTEFLSAVYVAALGGLGFLAYRHPTGFRKLAAIILAAAGIVAFLMVGYWSGVLATTHTLTPSIKAAGLTVDKVHAVLLPDDRWGWIVSGTIAYVAFLMHLPDITGKGND